MQIEEKALIEEKTLIEEKALNAKRYEDLLNAIFALMAELSIPPPRNSFCSSFCPLFSPLFFPLLLEPVPSNCFALSGCAI